MASPRVRLLATLIAQALLRFRPPENKRAQGMPDARCTRDLMCNGTRDCANEHTGQRRTSDIPCAMALRLISCSPQSGRARCHCRRAGHEPLRNLTVCGFGAVVCSWSLLFMAIIAVVRQKFHVSDCSNLRSRLSPALGNILGQIHGNGAHCSNGLLRENYCAV